MRLRKPITPKNIAVELGDVTARDAVQEPETAPPARSSRAAFLRKVAGGTVAALLTANAGALFQQSKDDARMDKLQAELTGELLEAKDRAYESGMQDGILEGLRLGDDQRAVAVEATRVLDDNAANMAVDCTMVLQESSPQAAILTRIFKGRMVIQTKNGITEYQNPLVLASEPDINPDLANIRFGISATSGSNKAYVRPAPNGQITLIPQLQNDPNPYADIMLYRGIENGDSDTIGGGKGLTVAMGYFADDPAKGSSFRVGMVVSSAQF
jgi:hypothetical protein